MQTHKWITFTYTGKETTYITNLFKRTNIKIAFRSNNTICSQLTKKKKPIWINTQSSEFINSHAQTAIKRMWVKPGGNFLDRYEHKVAIRNNIHTSKYAQHVLEQTHSFSTIDNMMQILHYQKKNPHFYTVE
jgi:hypothetical protein